MNKWLTWPRVLVWYAILPIAYVIPIVISSYTHEPSMWLPTPMYPANEPSTYIKLADYFGYFGLLSLPIAIVISAISGAIWGMRSFFRMFHISLVIGWIAFWCVDIAWHWF